MIKLLWKDMIIMRNKKIYLLGIILIIIGIMFGFEVLNFKIFRLIVKLILSVIIICLGFNVISSDKSDNKCLDNDYWTIFNDKKFIINDNSVKVFKTTALFGNITLDLRNIDLSDDIVIDNYVVFGKVNLYVTDNVKVVNNVSTVFGRTNIKYKSVDEKTINKLKAGDDITDLLKIEKYEEEEEASPKKQTGFVHFLMSHPSTRWFGRILLKHNKTEAGNFPSQIISKSDETTIQNCKTIIERFAKSEGYTSCKMEGQSGTYLFEMKGKKPAFFYVCSRNIAYKAKCDNAYWKIAQKYDLKNKIYDYWKKTGKLLVIQGE